MRLADIGKAIRRRRLELGITQVELMKELNGVQSTLSRIERGQLEPSLSEAIKICGVLFNSRLDYFITSIENEQHIRPDNTDDVKAVKEDPPTGRICSCCTKAIMHKHFVKVSYTGATRYYYAHRECIPTKVDKIKIKEDRDDEERKI